MTSSPRAETPVATMTGHLAVRKARLFDSLISAGEGEQKQNLHSILALTLSSTTVDRGGRDSRVVEEVVNKVHLFLAVDENQSAHRRHADNKVIDGPHLLVRISVDN